MPQGQDDAVQTMVLLLKRAWTVNDPSEDVEVYDRETRLQKEVLSITPDLLKCVLLVVSSGCYGDFNGSSEPSRLR